MKTAIETRKAADALKMLPFKFVVKVSWNKNRGEVSYLLMHAKPIDTEGASFASSATIASFLGVVDTL
eukprot:5008778-Prymnesium_polylepis.1